MGVDPLRSLRKPFGGLKRALLLTIFLSLVCSLSTANAGGADASCPTPNGWGGWLGLLSGPVEQDIPGATNPYMPLLFPPCFSAEVRVTPVYMNLVNGEIKFNGRSINLEMPDGIGLSSKGSYVDLMARIQISRFSFRVNYYADLRRIPAANPTPTQGYGYVNWLNWRLGMDIDVINMYDVRFGPTLDFNLERPSLSYNNLAQIPGNSGKVEGYAPGTLGLFVSYNPYYSWVVTPTFEFRYRWPLPFRSGEDLRAQMAQVTEWEYALGLKIPRSRSLGTFGLRFGSRNTKMEFGGTHETGAGPPVKLNWNGQFIEFVWFY